MQRTLNTATQHQSVPARPRNLGELNGLLGAAGLGPVSAAELAALREGRCPDDLARAATQARTNPNARAYLDRAIAEVRGGMPGRRKRRR